MNPTGFYQDLCNIENLSKGYQRILKKRKRIPSLQEEISAFLQNPEENLEEISSSLSKKAYLPSPVVIIYKRKKKGSLQGYGLTDLRDSIVLETLYFILSPYWEKRFLDSCLSYRKGYSRPSCFETI